MKIPRPLSLRPPLNAHAANVRSTFTLILAALGLVNVIDSLGVPWSSLVTTLLLALFALAWILH